MQEQTGSLKRRVRIIDPQELAKYLKKYPEANLYQVAEHFNCSMAAISSVCKRHINAAFEFRWELPDELSNLTAQAKIDAVKAQQYIEQHPNARYDELAKHLGCSDTHVRHQCWLLGFKRKRVWIFH
ncbi:hypothetical protein [Moraxella caviae]|uniref:hypothetical protein n=1 Tax=Moraxella caviae TaxID=34060 RepID=UPI00099276A5